MQNFITERISEIESLCRKHHVRRLSIFGSAVRDDFNPETSDVDVRVEFLPEADADYLKNLYAIEDTLPVLFNRKVDVISGEIRNPYFRQAVEADEVTLYAA
ncbi:MAG: nucleotidyltransferase domain-containing protein [Acidobacteria bacterium]|nr:nucleotidyltransferase domain-containing protein [Acidobacteriota bacterium]